MHTLLKCIGDAQEERILGLEFGGFPFLLCYSGAYGLASRSNFHITPTVVLMNVHIVEVHLEMHKKNPGPRIWKDFCFYCVAVVYYGLASIHWVATFTYVLRYSSTVAGCFCWIGGRSKRASEDQACAIWPQEVAFLPNLCCSQPCAPRWQAH